MFHWLSKCSERISNELKILKVKQIINVITMTLISMIVNVLCPNYLGNRIVMKLENERSTLISFEEYYDVQFTSNWYKEQISVLQFKR